MMTSTGKGAHTGIHFQLLKPVAVLLFFTQVLNLALLANEIAFWMILVIGLCLGWHALMVFKNMAAPSKWVLSFISLSGAVALAIASERCNCEVHGTDASEAAISVARDNAERLDISNVRFHAGSWCEPLAGPFHLVVSNPPYVAEQDPHLQQGDCRFEPAGALTPGGDGRYQLRFLEREARDTRVDADA